MTIRSPYIAIIDYGMGNLFSVKHACQAVQMESVVTSDIEEITGAAGVILPGVGAFGNAMENLRERRLVDVVRSCAETKPFMGICLGMQLIMSESQEFGFHAGLDIIKGSVVNLGKAMLDGKVLKIPQVQWNTLTTPRRAWKGTILDEIPVGEYMYFVHSFVVKPREENVVLSETLYGDVRFCSSLQEGKMFACQFHPERSGKAGLTMYRNFKKNVIRNA
jgi:glutamine amidotransferase